jgi:hypothetical protein
MCIGTGAGAGAGAGSGASTGAGAGAVAGTGTGTGAGLLFSTNKLNAEIGFLILGGLTFWVGLPFISLFANTIPSIIVIYINNILFYHLIYLLFIR